MSVTFLRPRRGLSVSAVWLDAMSCGATARAACSVEAGRHLCQSFVAPCRANQGHPKGHHWRGVSCCNQMLRALRLLACPIDIVIQACRHRRPCLQSVACKDYATTSGAGQHRGVWLLTCCIAGDGFTFQDATGNSHGSHVQWVDKICETAKVGVLGPCHTWGQLLLCVNLCTTSLCCLAGCSWQESMVHLVESNCPAFCLPTGWLDHARRCCPCAEPHQVQHLRTRSQ